MKQTFGAEPARMILVVITVLKGSLQVERLNCELLPTMCSERSAAIRSKL